MGLEELVREIRHRADEEIQREHERLEREGSRLAQERAARVLQLSEQARSQAQAEGDRERAQKVAAARFEARKRRYAAEAAQLNAGLDAARSMLSEYTSSPEYAKLLGRMVDSAQSTLGKGTRVRGRADDASLLKQAAGRAFDPEPLAILGGLRADSADGRRSLDLSFDELLRRNEDRVRQLIQA